MKRSSLKNGMIVEFRNVPVSQFAREIRKAEQSAMFGHGIVRFEIEGVNSKLFTTSRKNISYYDVDKQTHINLTGLVSGVIKIEMKRV